MIATASPPPAQLVNIAAEQALLGAILFENHALPLVDSIVPADGFAEPLHNRLYAALRRFILADRLADPVLIAEECRADPALADLGGLGYLVDLIDKAPPGRDAPEYARVIRELWQKRQLVTLSREISSGILAGDGTSGEAIQAMETRLLALHVQSRELAMVTAADAAARVVEQFNNPNISPGVKLGMERLDDAIGGLMPGELWLLGGRPSMGKSALASCACLNVARFGTSPDGQRLGVIEISGEMTVEQMTRRHITDLAFDMASVRAPAYSDIRKRNVTDYERDCFYRAAAQFGAIDNLVLFKRTGMTMATIRSIVRRQVAAWARVGIKLGLVCIDHVGLVRPDGESRGRTEAQTEVAIGAKEMADELGVPILALAQLNRQLEGRDDKRPTLPDLKDSGAWEENADGVIGLYREAYYAQREGEPKKHDDRVVWESRKASKTIDAILLKIREGAIKTIPLWGDLARNAIRDVQPDFDYQGADFSGYGATGRQKAPDLLNADAALPAATAAQHAQAPASEAASYQPGEFE